MSKKQKILCVDLDGTLVNTDMLWESFLFHLKKNPLVFFFAIFWLLFQGKSGLKRNLAKNFDFDPKLLPYNQQIISFIQEQKSKGYTVWLVSASYETIVKKIYEFLSDKLFDGYYATGLSSSIGSTDKTDKNILNLASKNKSEFLDSIFGPAGYDYIGNSSADIKVWNSCDTAYIFCSRKQGLKYTGSVTNANNRLIEKEPDFSTLGSKIKLTLKQVRIHQWAKNALIFCPALAVHSILTSEQYGNLVLAFSSFCLLTSSVYIINDLFDIWNDRAHQKKKNRPLASGNMSIPTGIIIAACCLSLSSIFALCLSLKFLAFTTLYFAINILYSFKLKNIMALDCVLLSGMYTYRIFLGCVAASLANSLWLFSFAIFLFLSLAFIKRYIELFNLKKQGKEQIIGRPYTVADSSVVETLYIVFGSLSILVFALYLSSTEIQHTFSSIWFAYASLLVILYWMIYMFIKASRGLIHEDPVVFVLKDRLSLISGLIFVTLFSLGAML